MTAVVGTGSTGTSSGPHLQFDATTLDEASAWRRYQVALRERDSAAYVVASLVAAGVDAISEDIDRFQMARAEAERMRGEWVAARGAVQ